ncbi:SRPBCC domain-containing protein [Chelatococcus asaccharovorans]|uniref:Polyketide cyclase/dehydrase/lipid transport protein n=1 Tax=Chelatococcus asaccharovorans TaxID=28210 RepID=A0A2V3U7G7_9HYPH|nr:SRPBCC domain-containing protein [Chelatococcus asaccharovorans]MBS7705652.1 SRPBCC domain-containing protein [Chelatococcus asaccharovorans]PXW58670.1 hypothetical protein C7450_10516 [Chelatococcus asaccharovorans]
MFRHTLTTQIAIAAPAARIWQILMDFAAYPEWNPFIRSAQGTPQPGERLTVHIQASGTKGMTFRPKVLAATPEQELRWLGHLGIPGLFDGEHLFTLHPVSATACAFQQAEAFRGLLVPLFRGALDRDTKRGFEEMNQALKARAEAA